MAPAVIAVLAASVLLAVTVLWGRRLADDGVQIFLSAPPFSGAWGWRWPSGLWWAVLLGALLVAAWPAVAARARWTGVLVGSWAGALAWSSVLATSGGIYALAAPLTTRFEYLPLARRTASPLSFLRTFVERLPGAPTHVKGHPPGAVLAFLGLDRLGFGDLAVAVTVVAVAASAAPAALIALDRTAGRGAARRAAVFVGLAPAVVWTATSTDALFMAVATWAVALGALAVTTDGPRRVVVATGAAAGALAGTLVTFTYGAPTLLGGLWALAIWAAIRRRTAALVAGAAGLLLVPAALAAAGFDWIGGLAATNDAYRTGVAAVRPGGYFLVANLAVLAVAVGPATMAGAAWLRDHRAWLLVGGTAAGILLADLSGLSKGEVERIWLPAVPLLVLATCSIRGEAARRCWLGAQLGGALLLQAWLRSPW
jgi:hypothetical protein